MIISWPSGAAVWMKATAQGAEFLFGKAVHIEVCRSPKATLGKRRRLSHECPSNSSKLQLRKSPVSSLLVNSMGFFQARIFSYQLSLVLLSLLFSPSRQIGLHTWQLSSSLWPLLGKCFILHLSIKCSWSLGFCPRKTSILLQHTLLLGILF